MKYVNDFVFVLCVYCLSRFNLETSASSLPWHLGVSDFPAQWGRCGAFTPHLSLVLQTFAAEGCLPESSRGAFTSLWRSRTFYGWRSCMHMRVTLLVVATQAHDVFAPSCSGSGGSGRRLHFLECLGEPCNGHNSGHVVFTWVRWEDTPETNSCSWFCNQNLGL